MSLSSGIHGLGLPLGKALGTASPDICGPKEASQIVLSPLLSQGHRDQPWGHPNKSGRAGSAFQADPHYLLERRLLGLQKSKNLLLQALPVRRGSSQPPLRLS